MSENTTYSPGEQQLLNTTVGNMNTEASTASNLQGQIATNAATPINYAAENAMIPGQAGIGAAQTADFNAQMAQLQPLEQEQTEQEQSQLANQGISTGSQAYNNGMYTVGAQQNNAAEQALSNAQAYGAQANSTALSDMGAVNSLATQQQTQPINEYSSLMGGTQVQAPSFQGAPSSSSPSASVPMAGNELEQQYSQQMQAYNAQVASNNSASQGLFGLGGSLGSAAITGAMMSSDIRLKKDIKKLGKMSSGLPFYSFKYIGETIEQIGLMAQEVIKIFPEAVSRAENGFLMVDYAKVH